ncbi:MAG: GAF domain-containing protein, partial [Firmicutes bacterium]|nr:GAF domain-containing protein [Bacillota bacterium]
MGANENFVKSAWMIMDELQNAGQMESALQSIIEKLGTEFGCSDASIWLKHDADQKHYMIASKGNQDNAGLSIGYKLGLIGKVADTGNTEYVKDCHNDSRIDQKHAALYGDSCLAIPLKTPDDVLG